jgi:hypothetical protein
MHLRKKWLPYVIAALVLLAVAQFAVIGAGVAGWLGH